MNHEIKTANLFFLGDLSLVFSFILFPWDGFKTFSILCLLSIHIFLGFLSMTPFKAFKTEQILFLFHTHTHTKFFGSLWRCSLSSDLARTRRISRKILIYTGKLTKNSLFSTHKAEVFIKLDEPLETQFRSLNMGYVIYHIPYFSICQIF